MLGDVLLRFGYGLVMFGQAVPIGINLTSPVTWFVVAIAVIVFALTVSTRRGNLRSRSASPAAPVAALEGAARSRDVDEWAAAQASFVESPRAGCERAQTIAARVLRERGFDLEKPGQLDTRYVAGCLIVARADASTDDLRRAFIDFRAAFDAVVATAPKAGDL